MSDVGAAGVPPTLDDLKNPELGFLGLAQSGNSAPIRKHVDSG